MFRKATASVLIVLVYAQSLMLGTTFAQSGSIKGDADSVEGLDARENPSNAFDVHVLGAVAQPGTYRIRPNQRVLHALQAAGNVTPKSALTRFELRRPRQKTKILNFLRLFREGTIEDNPYLQENDVVFIPVKSATVNISGPVRYPANYEIAPDDTTTLLEVVDFADGFTTGLAQKKPLTIIRYNSSNERVSVTVDNDRKSLAACRLQNGDTIIVPHKFTVNNSFNNSVESLPDDSMSIPSFTKDVFVIGGVRKPGKIPFNPQLSLEKYVAMSGGLSRLGREDVIIYRMDGSQEESTIFTSKPVNPGETIVVGENKLGPEFWITLMTTIAGLSLSSVAIFRN